MWWLGATKAAVRRALADVDAVQVSLDSGDTGWVLPGDDEPEDPVGRLGRAAACPRPDHHGLEAAGLLP